VAEELRVILGSERPPGFGPSIGNSTIERVAASPGPRPVRESGMTYGDDSEAHPGNRRNAHLKSQQFNAYSIRMIRTRRR